MKKVARFTLAALLLFFLFGCVEVVYEIGIDENDLEHLTMRMGMPAILAPYLGDVVAKVKNEGFDTRTETEGDKVWIIGTKEFAKGQWDIPALPGSVTVTTVTRDVFKVDDYILLKKYTLDAEYQYQNNTMPDPTTGGNTMYSVPVKFMVTLPGTIFETNANERQGRTAVWNYVMAPTGTISMKLVTYKPKWALVSALVVSLAVFSVAIVLVAVRMSRSRAARTRPPAGPSAPGNRAAQASPGISGKPTAPTAASPASSGGTIPRQAPSGGPGVVRYDVLLSLPPDSPAASRIIRTLAQSRNKTTDQITAELRSGGFAIVFSDKTLLEKNLKILSDAGFNPKVTVRKR